MSEIWLHITVILEFEYYGIMLQKDNSKPEYKLVDSIL